ncbi:uncharacterized protein TNCV_4773661 [Trichonephila clavipes]|nr:uncharacterized protein TNCV_4773661 [Trichonephila clavipes]
MVLPFDKDTPHVQDIEERLVHAMISKINILMQSCSPTQSSQKESREISQPFFGRVVPTALKVTATRVLLATDHVILNHGQVTWTTPELVPPLLTTTPHQREDLSALDRFNVHRCPTRRVFSGTGLEPVTKQATVRPIPLGYRGHITRPEIGIKSNTIDRWTNKLFWDDRLH